MIEALAPLMTHENIAIAVLAIGLTACGSMHLIQRKEDREDRKQMLKVLDRNTEAVNGLKQLFAAISGRF